MSHVPVDRYYPALQRRQTEDFERLFEAEVYPMWQAFKAAGKVLRASLVPVEDGSELKDGVQDYILEFEAPGMDEHEEFDSDPRFLAFLEKVRPMQPEEPKVWFGTPKFEV